MLRRLVASLAGITLVVALQACSDDALEVTNPNHPDRGRTLGNPADVEGLASAQFGAIINATLGDIARLQTSMAVMSFENAATGLANNGMPRGAIPRQVIDNSRGNAYSAEGYADFQFLSFVARNSADILQRAKQEDFSLGTGREGDLIRLKAFAHFTAGVALGYLSCVYDSAGVPRDTDGPLEVPPLEGYKEVNAYALAQLDSALAYAMHPAMTALPAGWLTGPGGPQVSPARFAQIIRSFRARLRASVARDPEERAAVDWSAVIADATNGITSDFEVMLDPGAGWDYEWLDGTLHFRDTNWHQMTPYIIGMADISGAFDQWLATPRDQRTNFLIITPDLRFPQGNTREEQNADRGGQGAPTGGKYFRNRLASLDNLTPGWANSQYDHYRFRALSDAGRVGPLPFFTKAENDMLAAEGYIRQGNIAAAAALIDITRTKNGLPALSGVVTSIDDPVPGGDQCVPRVPTKNGPTVCGNIMEAMKWEKRMETAFTTYGVWFFDARGWGDLPVGTALEFPLPYQEADARGIPFYNLGGVGGPRSSAGSTYGYGDGNR
ncbi:MAG: hypothetical protein DIU52_010755 [bacterium]|nr:MAG: hypothetical protein DIU52_06635 [bacterium]